MALQVQENNTRHRYRFGRCGTPLATLSLLMSIAALSACGFNLRGTAETLPATFPSLDVQCEQKRAWRLCHYLNGRITSAGSVIDDKAPVTLTVSRSNTQNRVFSLNTDATAAERELQHAIHYQLYDKESGTMLSERTISRNQIYRHNASALIAKDREKEELEKSLDENLIDIMLREISILSRD